MHLKAMVEKLLSDHGSFGTDGTGRTFLLQIATVSSFSIYLRTALRPLVFRELLSM